MYRILLRCYAFIVSPLLFKMLFSIYVQLMFVLLCDWHGGYLTAKVL